MRTVRREFGGTGLGLAPEEVHRLQGALGRQPPRRWKTPLLCAAHAPAQACDAHPASQRTDCVLVVEDGERLRARSPRVQSAGYLDPRATATKRCGWRETNPIAVTSIWPPGLDG
jgi:hypothetical protein